MSIYVVTELSPLQHVPLASGGLRELCICQMNRPKAGLVKMVSRLAINRIIGILKDESALLLWHANVFRESLVWQGLIPRTSAWPLPSR